MPDAIELFRAKFRRQAVVMEIGGFRPVEDARASWFGHVTCRLPHETWPVTTQGKPMAALAQINLTGLPFVPPRLKDLEMITVFIDPTDPGGWDERGSWCLRAYPRLAALVPLVSPGSPDGGLKPFQMKPKLIEEDYPVYDDIEEEIPVELQNTEIFRNVSGFKLGGWPSLIQSEIFWAPFNRHPARPEFVFQIDSTAKGNWSWGDSGVGYFGRGTSEGHRNEWILAWQCM